MLGAVIDGISHADELLALGLEDVLDGDVALAFVALMQHGACHGALVDVPPSLREFVAGRMVEPVHEVDGNSRNRAGERGKAQKPYVVPT